MIGQMLPPRPTTLLACAHFVTGTQCETACNHSGNDTGSRGCSRCYCIQTAGPDNWAAMYRFLARTRLVFAALLIAALAVVPTLEAMACAGEPPSESQFLQLCSAAGDADTAASETPGPIDPATCPGGHNHCHDGGGVVSTSPVPPHAFRGLQLPAQGGRVLALSDIAQGLMRPPRR